MSFHMHVEKEFNNLANEQEKFHMRRHFRSFALKMKVYFVNIPSRDVFF